MGIGDIRNICNEIRKDLEDISGHFKSFPTVACPQKFRKTELKRMGQDSRVNELEQELDSNLKRKCLKRNKNTKFTSSEI